MSNSSCIGSFQGYFVASNARMVFSKKSHISRNSGPLQHDPLPWKSLILKRLNCLFPNRMSYPLHLFLEKSSEEPASLWSRELGTPSWPPSSPPRSSLPWVSTPTALLQPQFSLSTCSLPNPVTKLTANPWLKPPTTIFSNLPPL
jgi:hypothetical protein